MEVERRCNSPPIGSSSLPMSDQKQHVNLSLFKDAREEEEDDQPNESEDNNDDDNDVDTATVHPFWDASCSDPTNNYDANNREGDEGPEDFVIVEALLQLQQPNQNRVDGNSHNNNAIVGFSSTSTTAAQQQQQQQDFQNDDDAGLSVTAPPAVVDDKDYDDGMMMSPTKVDDDYDPLHYSTPLQSPTVVRSSSNSATNSSSLLLSSKTNHCSSRSSSGSDAAAKDVVSEYGGLVNLGNTCYIASALQMLCSIDSFAHALTSIPATKSQKKNAFVLVSAQDDQETEDCDGSDSPLRRAFLNLAQGLLKRKTSPMDSAQNPQAFKDALDDRTTLFHGYRQQDSHEFLTTLLDLLDEDYYSNDDDTERTEQQLAVVEPIPNTVEPMDGVVFQPMQPFDNNSNIDSTVCSGGDSTSSCHKKPRTDYAATAAAAAAASSMEADHQEMDDEFSTETARGVLSTKDIPLHSSQPLVQSATFNSNQSLSDLDVEAIGRLLHGEAESSSFIPTTNATLLEAEQPHYKLIGGRMNTADVVLTPFAEYEHDSLQQQQRGERVITRAEAASMSISSSIGNSSRMDTTAAANDGDSDENYNAAAVHQEHITPVSTTFTTQVRIRLTCDSCKYTRCHTETFLHLSLEIDSTAAMTWTMEDGLRRFFAPCSQEIKCEKCFCETATQKTEITKLPPVLLLHLKRFIVDVVDSDWSNVSYRKDQSAVILDERLSLDKDIGVLSEFLAPDCSLPAKAFLGSDQQPFSYSLQSVVNHIGSSATCGHYTADAKRMYDQLEWTRFNDDCVHRISAVEALEQSRQTAYMCLYEVE